VILQRARTLELALLIAVACVGCAGAQPKQAGEENNFEETPSGPAVSEQDNTAPASSSTEGESDEQKLSADQKAQMDVALRRGGAKAAQCSSVVADAPSGEGEVKVLFDGKKGRSVDVTVGSPFAGTPAEACIKRSFVGEIIMPFDGTLEVPYKVKLPPKATEDDKATADKEKKK